MIEVEATGGGSVEVLAGGADLALVLDVSGSMNAPDRYPLLRRAVRACLAATSPEDRIAIVLFSDRSAVLRSLTTVGQLRSDDDALLRAMDGSDSLFGGGTFLSPALWHALEALDGGADRVRRVYVLTDGEIHDSTRCFGPLAELRRGGVEVHVYGFGLGFRPDALKRLVSDQLGGTVKPIVEGADIEPTFVHIGAVNRRLVARDAVLVVELHPAVCPGDAWRFRPQERHLGPIAGRALEVPLGAFERGRTYSVLLELRLSSAREPVTPLAAVSLAVLEGERHRVFRRSISAPRARTAGQGPEVADRVRRAAASLEALRRPDDAVARRAALLARKELAVLEGRDPRLIAALERRIAGGAALKPSDALYLESDHSSVVFEPPIDGGWS